MKNLNTEKQNLETRMLNNKKALIFVLSFVSVFSALILGRMEPFTLHGAIIFGISAALMSAAMMLNKVPPVYTVSGILALMMFGGFMFYGVDPEQYKDHLVTWMAYPMLNAVRGCWIWANLIPKLKTDTKEIDIWSIEMEM